MTSESRFSPNQITAGRNKPPHLGHFGNSSTGIFADSVFGSGLPEQKIF